MLYILIKVITRQPVSSVGYASASSGGTTSSSVTISSDDCARAKDCLAKTAKYATVGACFGLGYGARSLYDALAASGHSGRQDDSGTTTGSPFRSSGLGTMNDSYLDKLNNGKIY